MAVNLVELISNAITPDTLQGMSRVLGERDSAVQSGISALLPVLVGGMAAKASTPSGASNLMEMINSSSVDTDLVGKIGGMLGSDQSSSLLQQGSSLLGGLFGADKASNIATTLAGMTGMKTGSATSLLTMIVPLVLSVLKRFFTERRLGPNDVAGMFSEQKSFLDGKLDPRLTSALGFATPTGMLSGLSDTAATAARTARGTAAAMGTAGVTAATAAPSAATPSGTRWMPWALAAVVAAALLFMLPRFGGDKGEPSVAKAPAPATTTPAPASPVATLPAPAAPAPAAPTTAMGAAPASLPAKIYFETGKADLGPEGTAVVKSVAGILAADPSAKVALTGFTDKSGDTAANEELAKKRATAVKSALEAAGVASDRVGMKEPAFVEAGAGGSDQEARRVDIAAAK